MTADASGFVARIACPACDFPIGVRREDVAARSVSCPVCQAAATISERIRQSIALLGGGPTDG